MFSRINRQVKRFVIRQQRKRPVVLISDTTLRDGAQMPGVHLAPEAKVQIAEALAQAGVHSIDCGFPAASQAEFDGVAAVAGQVRGPVLSAIARTKRSDIERAAEALASVNPLKRAVQVFIGTSPLHRDHKHEMTKAQIIDTTCSAIEFAQKHFEIISFGPEDASRTEPEFLIEVYEKAIQAGAMSIGFSDTVGVLTPGKSADWAKRIQQEVPSMDDAFFAVHFHNDIGLATANSLACVEAGANIVQGTINGIGERAGNAPIEEVVTALVLHADQYKKKVSVNPATLCALSSLVARLSGFAPPANKAVVGENIFRTEAGIHQNALLQEPQTYLPFPPELIGAGPVKLVLGANSGRSAVRYHLRASGADVSEVHVEAVLNYLKGRPHNPADYPEIHEFLERIRPFMADDQRLPPETLREGREAV